MRLVGELITQTVDFADSEIQHRTVVLQGVDPTLDDLKRTYGGLEDFLSKVCAKLMTDIPEWATQYVCNCVFFPQLGFLTAVILEPETGRGKYEGEGTDDSSWDLMFCTADRVYYKNRQMKEIDGHFGDLYGMVCG